MTANWPVVSLGDISNRGQYGYTASASDFDTGRRFLRTTDIVKADLDWGTVPFCEIDDEAFAKYKLEPGDLVISRMGSIGVSAFIQDPPDAVFASYLIRFRIEAGLADPRYVYYALQSAEFASFVKARGGSGSVQPNINARVLSEFRLRLPPIEEQRAIASVLGALDDKIELNRRMSETLETLARAIFTSWFVDFDPVRAKAEGRDVGLPQPIAALFPNSFEQVKGRQIPAGWSTTTLGEIAFKPEYGYTASASLEPVGPKFLRITDINKRPWIEWSFVPHCRIDPAGHQRFQVRRGDILIARMADPGHTAVIEEQVDAVFASYLIRFRLLDDVYARYLQYWTRSDEYWDLVRARGLGTTRTTLNAQVLRGFVLVLPPRPVAVAFRRQIAVLRDRLVMSVREAESLAATRDTLLPKLISGEVRVLEAERMVEATPT